MSLSLQLLGVLPSISRLHAVEMRDVTLPATPSISSSPRITVELKLKQLTTQNASHHMCYNCLMHMNKTLLRKYIGEYFAYCPLAFYRGDDNVAIDCIAALFAEPRHNLRLFLDGRLIYSYESTTTKWQLNELLRKQCQLDSRQLSTLIVNVLRHCSRYNHVLSKLYAAQKLDVVGIHAAQRIYNNLPEDAQRLVEDGDFVRQRNDGAPMTLSFFVRIFVQYFNKGAPVISSCAHASAIQ